MKKIRWSNFLSLILDIIKIYGINFMICNGQETVFHFPKVGDFEEWGAVIYNFKMFLVTIFFKKDVAIDSPIVYVIIFSVFKRLYCLHIIFFVM